MYECFTRFSSPSSLEPVCERRSTCATFVKMYLLRTTALAGFLAVVCFGAPAAAPTGFELVYFASGRVMPIAGHHIDGPAIVLELRGGGAVRCDPLLIDRIELDGTPRSEPELVLAVSPTKTSGLRMMERPYGALIQRASKRHGVDSYLIHALIEAESGYRPTAVSHRGAMGLMQLMPALAGEYAVADPFDPPQNIEAGTRHLRRLIDKYGIAGALAAYNAGEGSVRKFDGMPPFPETHRYVAKVMDLVEANQAD